jgi:hypothetical protein
MSTPAAAVLAASDTGKGSPIGLFVVLLLVIATYLLYRSMTGHIRRLPERFPGYRTGADETARPDGTDSTGGDAAAENTAGPDGDRPGPP